MSGKIKQMTYTYLVLECLKERNDYVSYEDIYNYVRETRYEVAFSHISAACFHLKKHKAVDLVIDSDGKVFWYLTPETDDRAKTIDERVPESKPRKRKKGYKRRITVVIDGGGL